MTKNILKQEQSGGDISEKNSFSFFYDDIYLYHNN